LPTVPFARKPVPKLAFCAKPKPARLHHLARRGTARSQEFAQPGTPAFPRSCSLPSGATFFAHDVKPRGRGWTNRRVRVFGAGVHGDIRESNRHGPDKSGLQGGSVQVRHCEEHVVQRRGNSRAENNAFAIACAIRGGVQSNLRAILAPPSVG
jgi:hypothetical protein